MWRIVVAAALVGLFGFVGGYYVGPSFLCIDDCTVAPLNGIFFSGPGGLALGAALGAIGWVKKWQFRRYAAAVAGASLTALAVGTTLSWPEPRLQAQFVRGEISDCRPPSELMAQRVEWWRSKIATEQWMAPRGGWESDVPQMLARNDGVVLTITVQGRRDVYRRREPWHYGRLDSTRWRHDDKPEQFFARFAGTDCGRYHRGQIGSFTLAWEASRVSPPDVLPTFLGLYVITPVTAEGSAWHRRLRSGADLRMPPTSPRSPWPASRPSLP